MNMQKLNGYGISDYRLLRLARKLGRQCWKCGNTYELTFHHINGINPVRGKCIETKYSSYKKSIENDELALLCRKCHNLYHNRYFTHSNATFNCFIAGSVTALTYPEILFWNYLGEDIKIE